MVNGAVLENAAVLMNYFIILTKTCRLGFSLSISLCCFVGDNINCILCVCEELLPTFTVAGISTVESD